jgi:hypothetical protein
LKPKRNEAQRSAKINGGEVEIILTKKMGGTLVEIRGDEFVDVRRLYDQPALRRIIESLDTLGRFDFSGGTVHVDPADQDQLARLFERFL